MDRRKFIKLLLAAPAAAVAGFIGTRNSRINKVFPYSLRKIMASPNDGDLLLPPNTLETIVQPVTTFNGYCCREPMLSFVDRELLELAPSAPYAPSLMDHLRRLMDGAPRRNSYVSGHLKRDYV